MKSVVKPRVPLVLAIVVLLSVGAGIGAWLWARPSGPRRPEISAYSHGRLTRVGPYEYCKVLDLNDCEQSHAQGELQVSGRYPVQLSVPEAIARAPWQLVLQYEDSTITGPPPFRPGKWAVTLPVVDRQHGRLTVFEVQLLTLAIDPSGEASPVPHAIWSVRLSY